MKLVDTVVLSFKIAKVIFDNTDQITSIDFSANGDALISCTKDDQIQFYDIQRGALARTANSKKYGVELIHFIGSKNRAIHSSNKVDDTIRCLSIDDNRYIRYFHGHTNKVVSLGVSSNENSFISGSMDKTVRLWDLRYPYYDGKVQVNGTPVAGYDPKGIIFAVGINSECLQLYDLRYFDKGPFFELHLPQGKQCDCDWTGLKFSPNGKKILLSTNGSIIHQIDSFDGTPIHILTGHMNNKRIPIESSFSPDSQFIFSGSTNGRVHVWNAETGFKVCIFNTDHTGPVQCVQFNPKFMMLASACRNMAFWLPTVEETA